MSQADDAVVRFLDAVAEAARKCADELRAKAASVPAHEPVLPDGTYLGPRERAVLGYFQQLGPNAWRTARQVVDALGGDEADIYFPLNNLPKKGLLHKSLEEHAAGGRRRQIWALATPAA